MFEFETAMLIGFLNSKIEQVPDYYQYLENRVGGTSPEAVNSLLCRFTTSNGLSSVNLVSDL